MTKLNKLTIASLLVFIALNKTASAEQSEFLNAIKNINLQSIGANETVEPSDNRSQNINSEASINDKLEQKNKKLQMKYEKLLALVMRNPKKQLSPFSLMKRINLTLRIPRYVSS